MSFRLDDDAMKVVTNLFKNTGLDYGLRQFKAWRDKCKGWSDQADATAIAEAGLNPAKVEDWQNEFWDAYANLSPILSLCLRNGNYEVDSTTYIGTLSYILPKIAVIDWRYPIGGASGRDYARALASQMEGQLLAKMVAKRRSTAQIEGTLADLMERAAAWLKKSRCEGEKGMVIAMTKHAPNSELFRDDSYVPSWMENVESRGFKGFYEGFPVVWYKENEGAEEGEQERQVRERECVVAVDLRGWKGVNVRESVVTEQEFGELSIHTWSEEEIQTAIESKKLKLEDVNRAKSNCPVDITLHWELSSSRPPHRRTFQIQGSVDEALPADKSQPTEQ